MDNIMISDSPYDYLTLYANAHEVHTDLVHATVTSLQYGVPVKFFSRDGRVQLFDSIEELKLDTQGFYRYVELQGGCFQGVIQSYKTGRTFYDN